jgi:hypothetical protein
VLDARAARPVRAIVDRAGAALRSYHAALVSRVGAERDQASVFSPTPAPLYAVPTEWPGAPSFTFAFLPVLSPAPPATDAGLVYNLALVARGRIPEELDFRVRDPELAVVQAEYASQGVEAREWLSDLPLVPDVSVMEVLSWRLPIPGRRIEAYTAGRGIAWLHGRVILAAGGEQVGGGEELFSLQTYRPGRLRAAWNEAPLGPAFAAEALTTGDGQLGNAPRVVRLPNDLLHVVLALFSPAAHDQFTVPALIVDAPLPDITGTLTLTRDGQVVGSSEDPQFGLFPIPREAGTYTLRAAARRNVPWSVLGTQADVSWTFREPGDSAPMRPLPLLAVRASGRMDGHGRAPAGRPFPLRLHVQRQPGAPFAALRDLQMEASFDDGAHWTAVRVEPRGGADALAVVPHPEGDGFVSLRFRAEDAEGNGVVQTLLRAYAITGAAVSSSRP